MPTVIAIGGKGGTGKTVVAALLIELLSTKGIVLAVDADPSTNLNEVLGLELKQTIGQVREDFTEETDKAKLSVGVPKQDVLDLKIAQALVEASRIDLLAMGRPEGSGCRGWRRCCCPPASARRPP